MSINARLIAACICVSASLSAAPAAAVNSDTINSEAGETAVYVPDQYSRDRRWPLVILLHGAGATGDMQDLHLGIGERVSAKGMILAVPEARVAGSGSSADFLLGLISSLKQQYMIDDQSVFLIGHSMGGYQSLRFACDHGDVISGMVISAAAGVCNNGQAPVRLLLATGDADISDAHVDATITSWRQVNRCTAAFATSDAFDLHWDIAGAESVLTSWDDCETNQSVASMRSRYGRHIPIFKGEFADVAIDFLLNGRSQSAPAVRPACMPENDDRNRFVKHTTTTSGQMHVLTVQEFADNRCTRLLSTVRFSGPATQLAGYRITSAVSPLRFETVSATAHDAAVAADLSAGQDQESSLCGVEWQQDREFVVSGRDAAARRSCLTSVGNVSGPASFLKRLLLSYLFSPALP